MTPRDDKGLICPGCGMTVRGRKSVCPGCGKKLDRGAKFKCPSCGERIPKKSRACPICGVDLQEETAKTKPQSVKRASDEQISDHTETELTQEREEDKRFSCPKCDSPLIGTESKCPECGQVLKGKSVPLCRECGTPVEKASVECPTCAIAAEHAGGSTESVTSLDSVSMNELPDNVSDGTRGGSRQCSVCGIVFPPSAQKCPLCNTSFAETKPQDQTEMADADSSKVPDFEDSAPAPAKVETQPIKPVRKRTLRSAQVVTTPVAARSSAQGRTNGVVPVKGTGTTNGTGAAATGEAFVNGTGVSNGLGVRSKESAAKRTAFLTRWQVLAVLAAVLIIIPTFMFLSYANESDQFSIDGRFADWDGATVYGTKIQSTASTSNITEWAVGSQSSDLFLYIRTQTNMMSTTDAESYYLFVDSDGSNKTGYIMDLIGADYMLQLTGWDSAIRSTSLSKYSPSPDQYNWTAWTSIGSLSRSLDGERLEARATLPVALGLSAKFVLISKDSAERGSVSYTAPLKGGLLVVEQVPSVEVTAYGIMPKAASVTMLSLIFTCEGEDGRIDEINPNLKGAPLVNQVPAFSLKIGEKHETVIAVDSSAVLDGQIVSAELLASGIVSSFASVEVIGDGVSAYVGSSPFVITIDGAFADWTGSFSADQDSIPAASPGTDIDEIGNVITAHDSYFYVSVEGEICSGTFVPAAVSKPVGPGGSGVVIPKRRTAEDVLRVYIDSDRSDSTGEDIAFNTMHIGADQLIEVKGLFGRITSMKEFDYSSSGSWVETLNEVKAAKDTARIEISVTAASIDGSADIDFIVETTTWEGRSDLAIFDPSSMSASSRTWIVDPASDSPYATSMSYQRKMFYDGINYWSFYFDGTSTVHRYSADEGQTWTQRGSVFVAAGVNETSIWYDSSTSTVYAVGDASSTTNSVSIQVGTVDAKAHTISWAASDSGLKTSSFALSGKNTYICKDSNGYLWVLSSNCTQATPAAYQLSAFRSSEVNSTNSWVFTGQMLTATSAADNVKGSIVPAGSGSDVWAVYGYAGNVAARKYDGIWLASQMVYTQAGSKANTDNSPPSVVVDRNGVVHVVYGTGRRTGQTSTPTIEYSHNNTGLTTFTGGMSLDPLITTGIGDYYPTISLETSTGELYVLWLQSDTTFAPKTVMGSKFVSGTWSTMTIEHQTTFTKQHMTSIFYVSGTLKICWQWTQNTTAPTEVYCDGTMIPEFGGLMLPVLGTFVLFAVCVQMFRGRKGPT